MQPTALDVQRGANQRSFIRYLDVVFSREEGVNDLLAAGRIALVRFDTNGGGAGVNVPLAGKVSRVGNALAFDFGPQGIGGNRNSAAGNGYYSLKFDISGDGDFTDDEDAVLQFYRLFGDTNRDRRVNQDDINAIVANFGRNGPNLDADINGDTYVNILDRMYASQNLGKLIDPTLDLDD